MRITSLLLLLSVSLTGCNQEDDNNHADNDPPPKQDEPVQPITAGEEHQWGIDLIQGAEGWEAVTTTAVPANVTRFGLCRRRIPGVDDFGPHSGYSLAELSPAHKDEAPKSPANQFIVNPIGRAHFYLDKPSRIDPEPPVYPVGTVIIKEKYNEIEDANKRINPNAFGVMIKHEPGYDAEHNDWEYAYIEVDGEKTITGTTRGKLANCIDCHANRKHTDYVFRNYPLMPSPK